MKVWCSTCHLHFQDDFRHTRAQTCDFWKDLGLEELSWEDKEALWDWTFSFDFDDLFVRTGIQLEAGFHRARRKGSSWEETFPSYGDLTDAEKRELQVLWQRVLGLPRWRMKLWFLWDRIRTYLSDKGIWMEYNPVWRRAFKRNSNAGISGSSKKEKTSPTSNTATVEMDSDT